MSKIKFLSKKEKNKFSILPSKERVLPVELSDLHVEMFSNKEIIIDGCVGVSDYTDDYIKLKLKKGYFILFGSSFHIYLFEDETISIKGVIKNIELCI